MFYKINHSDKKEGTLVSALVALTPSESKRLIAKCVAKIPEITRALKNGLIIIARGSTNAFVAEEILGIPIEAKADEYCRGVITGGELGVNRKTASERNIANDFVLRQGKLDSQQPQEAIKEFTADDVFIKGANAIDSSGAAAVLVAGAESGVIGWALPSIVSRGAHLIVPVGLEKLIPSVALASQKCGIMRFKYSVGLPCGFFPISNAEVVTEIQAFAVLAGVNATHVASGGIGGSEGTVILTLEGSDADIEHAFELVKVIKGEPPVSAPEKNTPSAASFNYDPISLLKSLNR